MVKSVMADKISNQEPSHTSGEGTSTSTPATRAETKIPGQTIKEDDKVGYRLVSVDLLENLIQKTCVCRFCLSNCELQLWVDKDHGWATQLGLLCTNPKCKKYSTQNMSPEATKTLDNHHNSEEINRSLILGMRSIGKGRSAAVTLSSFLKVPEPLEKGQWRAHEVEMADSLTTITYDMKVEAARRVKNILIATDMVPDLSPDSILTTEALDELVVDCGVSFDGTWKNRGFTSHHCVVSAISVDTGEILDVEYISNLCSVCTKHKGDDQNAASYLAWFNSHADICPKNFDGPSQAMEAEGISRLFERSEDTLGLRYTTYVGDGDSSSFSRVSAEKPYGPGVEIDKEECVGHIQKRMGSRLRKLIQKHKGSKLVDGKPLDGKGRLTLPRVDALQRFYGKALRSNKGDAAAASSETMAGLYHYTGDHSYCPNRQDTWCTFKKDELNGTNDHQPVDKPFTPAMVALMKPVYDDLSDIDLLQHCSQCLTQNANESYNSVLWKMAPKEQYSSAMQIRSAMYLSTIFFNVDRLVGGKRVMEEVAGVECITLCQRMLASKDSLRLKTAHAKTLLLNQRRRVLKRLERSALAFRHSDSTSYQPNGYHVGTKKSRKVPTCRTCGVRMKGHGPVCNV